MLVKDLIKYLHGVDGDLIVCVGKGGDSNIPVEATFSLENDEDNCLVVLGQEA